MKKVLPILALISLFCAVPASAQIRVELGGTGSLANTGADNAFLIGGSGGGTFLEDVPSGTCDSSSFLRFDDTQADGSRLSCAAESGATAWDDISDTDADAALAFAEFDQTMDWDSAATAAAYDGMSFTVTHDSATDASTQRLVVIERLASSGTATFETLLQIQNADTDGAVTNGIEILAAAGTIATAIDASDAEITTALAIGANTITTAASTLASTELDLLDGHTGTLLTTAAADLESTTLTGAADTQLLVGDGATSAAWVTVSGDATLANTGNLSIDATQFVVFAEDVGGLDKDGVDTTGTIAVNPVGTSPDEQIDIFVNGFRLTQVASATNNDEFHISGTTVTFALAPSSGDDVTASYSF